MAEGLQIGELPQKENLTGNELIPFQQGSSNGSMSTATLKKYIGTGGGTGGSTDYMNYITEYNVSVQHPTSGIDGSNKYSLEDAIAQVPQELRNVGLKVSFINSDGKVETWEFQGGTFTNIGSWVQGGAQRVVSLEQENKENDVRINTIDGVTKTIVISVNKQGTNVVLMPVFKGQKVKITINAPTESRLLGVELSNEKSTSGTDKQRLFWSTLDKEKIIEAEANNSYSYLLIELWTTDILNASFEYQNTQKYALQEEYIVTAQKTEENYFNMRNAISQYSFSEKAQNYPDDFDESTLSSSKGWIGGGHKLSGLNKLVYGVSVYVEFSSEDIHENSEANEVCVFVTDTIPTQGAFLNSLNMVFVQTFNASRKGFHDVRFNSAINTNKDIFLFAYGVQNNLKFSNKKQSDKNPPFTNDFYFVNKPGTLENANISVYDTDWILQPTMVFYTEDILLQKKVLQNTLQISDLKDILGSFGNTSENIIDKPFNFKGKKVKVYQDSFGSFVLRNETFITPLGITLDRNAKGGRTLTTPAGTIKSGTPANENVLEYAMDDLTSDDYHAIIIALGTNDLSGVIRGTILLGDWDSEDTSTLYGALNYAVNRCKTNAPSAKVILVSPINRTNGWNGIAMQIIRNAIRNKALASGFSILDGSTSPFPNVDNDLSKLCWNDGLHPTVGIGSKMYDMWVLGNIL